MGKWNLYLFRNQDLLQRKCRINFFTDPPQNPHKQIINSTDTQEETVITPGRPLPY